MNPILPPDASAREAARLSEMGEPDPALASDEFTFVTRGVSATERAAVVAVLTQTRAEEHRRQKRTEGRQLQPWQRSQRLPERIVETYFDE